LNTAAPMKFSPMALLAGLVVTAALIRPAAAATERLRLATPVVANLVEAEAARLDRARPVAEPAAAPEPTNAVTLDAPVVLRSGRKVIEIPAACRDDSGRYDVLIHFHGVPTRIESAVEQSGVNAVLVVVNLGIGSGKYESAYAQDGSLARTLEDIDQLMQKHCPAKANGERGRVALAAWSAGYGAIYRVLANKTDRELVDSVMLADGLHAGFLDKFHQHLNELQMAPFTEFAKLAAKGDKLFAITHTGIVPPNYASTTQTASFLIHELGTERQSVDEQGPLPRMQETSQADLGGFHVRGFAGGGTDAHCDQLYAIGQTLFTQLAARWSH
jgi:hypothetical protein